jgi:Flp pilus assembly pilin Flp
VVLTGVLRICYEDGGQGIVEYALIIALITLVCFTALSFMGQALLDFIKQAAQEL